MKTIKCNNCDAQVAVNLEFCPDCGCYNELSEQCEASQPKDVYNKQPQSMDDVMRGMAKELSIIKTIMVCFMLMWTVGIVWIIVLFEKLF